MKLSTTPEPHWWSWADIVRRAEQLGIPHFQRGAVWDTGNRVALLESIYEQSPCGSFVLWAPDSDERESHRHGVPLHGFAPGSQPMWLVDGQCRPPRPPVPATARRTALRRARGGPPTDQRGVLVIGVG